MSIRYFDKVRSLSLDSSVLHGQWGLDALEDHLREEDVKKQQNLEADTEERARALNVRRDLKPEPPECHCFKPGQGTCSINLNSNGRFVLTNITFLQRSQTVVHTTISWVWVRA